ncbi:GNAT family N-acetyltransferase [Oxynema sp. CENA135]|uniref:GNAT family N-acetyltransferase n=1 Tax=Oxynema sp. CENA135 TaxID=984206 RepID=UPI00190DB6E4|nr:GNAT family N-acetyltransferase [Oxynema sp. CENA135]
MKITYFDCLIRPWQPQDRDRCARIIETILREYGLGWEPQGADRDVLEVERCYLQAGGEFWAIEREGEIVATSAYTPIARGNRAVEIRKMYLLPEVRGRGLGRFLLQQLEAAIVRRQFQQIWIETASVLTEAIHLYESSGYRQANGVETPRCDRVYVKYLNP